MPMIDITYPEGALSAEKRAELADELTTALLRAERAPDTQFFRDITWTYVHELPADHVLASGKPVAKPTFRIGVTTPEGALSDRRRKEMVESATAAVLQACDKLSDEDGMNVWVQCHEIAEGSWGAAGQVIQFQQLVAAAKQQREQSEDKAATPA